MVSEQSTDRVLEVFDRVGKILASMESFAGGVGLSKLELLALESVSKQNEIMMSQLANGLGITLSTATGIVDRLIDKKLVRRERNHGDRRVVKVLLTQKGERAALDHLEKKKEAINKMMSVLSVKEQEDFISIWQKIVDMWGE